MLETANSRIDIRELEQRIRWDAQRYNFVWHGTECYLPPGGRPEQQTTSATEAIAAASALPAAISRLRTLAAEDCGEVCALCLQGNYPSADPF
jgi:hypothetical protein